MFPSDINGIMPDNQLPNTCGVCGEPVEGIIGLALPLPEGLPLGKPHKCKTCKQLICSKHFSASRKQCVRCETGRDSWCKTPDMPT